MTGSRVPGRLHDHGLFVNLAIQPAVPPAGALMRTRVMATHERATIDDPARSVRALQRDRSSRLRPASAGRGAAAAAPRLVRPAQGSGVDKNTLQAQTWLGVSLLYRPRPCETKEPWPAASLSGRHWRRCRRG
jgi:hypothetical protein